jgi:carbamoyltransferase
MDLAASVQVVTEEIVLKMARNARKETGSKNLCLAGGVALNCVANGKIIEEGIFDNVWIQPAAGDAGGALGAALLCWHQLLKRERVTGDTYFQQGSLLGPFYTNDQMKSDLDSV